MKTVARTILVLLLAIWVGTAALAATQSYRLKVDGLACPFCAYGIEKKLSALNGVERLETNINDGTVIVVMKDGAKLDEAAVKQAVKDAGFTLKKFEPVSGASR